MYWPLSSERLPFFRILLLKHASSVWSRAKVQEKSILNKLAADSEKKEINEQTPLREGISIYIRSKMQRWSRKHFWRPVGGGGNKRYLCTEQTKWWIWNSSGPVLLTWKIALWIICAWLNRLWSVKSTQTLRRPAQHYSLVITEIRGIPWRALRVDSQDCLIMHRLLQKGGGGGGGLKWGWTGAGEVIRRTQEERFHSRHTPSSRRCWYGITPLGGLRPLEAWPCKHQPLLPIYRANPSNRPVIKITVV